MATADDRSQREHQAFWCRVLDTDGDGYVSCEDAKGFYDAVDKRGAAFMVGFEDLWHQILDMVKPSQPHRCVHACPSDKVQSVCTRGRHVWGPRACMLAVWVHG